MSYSKHNFVSNTVLYHTALNEMDDQIAKNESDIADLSEALETAEENIDDLQAIEPDTASKTVTFASADVTDENATAWTSVEVMASGEYHASLFAKISQMFKNIRFLHNHQLSLDSNVSSLNSAVSSILGDFATVQASTTASKAYKIGEFLVLNNLLYRVTAAIASGGTITVGTNVVRTTVGDEVANNVLWWSSQAIASTSGASGTLLTITDSRITADHVLDKFMPSNPSAITSDVTCTTSAGQAIFTGVSTSAITAEIKLSKKDN